MVKSGQTHENLIYQKIVGFKEDLSGPQNIPELLDDGSDGTISTSEEDNIDSDEKSKFCNSARPKYEDIESKRVRFSYFVCN